MLHSLKRILLIAALASFAASPAYATQADLDAEINRYVSTLQGSDFEAKRKVMERIEWSGYSSAKLYDAVAAALSKVQAEKGSAAKKQSMWYIKTLAMSGEEKYRVLLQDLADNSKVKKVVKRAASELDRWAKYKRWNPVISAGLANAPAGQLEQVRVRNMLNAKDPELLRIGAKRLYREHIKNDDLVALAKQRLGKEWSQVDPENGYQIDAVAWLIKSLAEAADKSSKPLLEKIAATSKVKKVRKYAKKYADYLN